MRCGEALARKIVDRLEGHWPPSIRELRIAQVAKLTKPIPAGPANPVWQAIIDLAEGNEHA